MRLYCTCKCYNLFVFDFFYSSGEDERIKQAAISVDAVMSTSALHNYITAPGKSGENPHLTTKSDVGEAYVTEVESKAIKCDDSEKVGTKKKKKKKSKKRGHSENPCDSTAETGKGVSNSVSEISPSRPEPVACLMDIVVDNNRTTNSNVTNPTESESLKTKKKKKKKSKAGNKTDDAECGVINKDAKQPINDNELVSDDTDIIQLNKSSMQTDGKSQNRVKNKKKKKLKPRDS